MFRKYFKTFVTVNLLCVLAIWILFFTEICGRFFVFTRALHQLYYSEFFSKLILHYLPSGLLFDKVCLEEILGLIYHYKTRNWEIFYLETGFVSSLSQKYQAYFLMNNPQSDIVGFWSTPHLRTHFVFHLSDLAMDFE